MATPLNEKKQAMKNRLIAEGCKVVERSWGHLVIMPTMGIALDYFKQAIDGVKNNPWLTNENHGILHPDSLSGVDKFMAQAKSMGVRISSEYEEKYRAQFDHLKDANKRERIYWIIEDAIRNGDPRKIDQINKLSAPLTELVYEICPSLRLDVQRERTENGPIWDAGLIGAEDPRPCWEDKVSQRIKRGSGGDGAYRIIINTDTSFGNKDTTNCLALCAMINVLQQYSDVEVWVQQGWLDSENNNHYGDGGNGMNGVTLFPAFRGTGLNPAQLMFWCGHPMRDSVFSNLINDQIGRSSSGTSEAAELDCDFYTRNGTFDNMPYAHGESPTEKEFKDLAKWVSGQLSKQLISEEDLSDLQTS